LSFFEKFIAPKLYRDSGDGGGSAQGDETGKVEPPEDGGASEVDESTIPEDTQEADNLSAEDLKLLKSAKVDPETFKGMDPEVSKQLLGALRKGAEFRDKVFQAEQAEKDRERERRRKEVELAKANLVDENGKLNTKHLKTLTEQAAKATGFEGLLEALAASGHLSEKVADLVSTKSPEVAAAALEYIEPVKVDVEAQVAAALKKRGGTNQGDRTSGGSRNEPEDETKQLVAQANQQLDSMFGDRRLPEQK